MEKRSELKKAEKGITRERRKRIAAFVFCVVFLLCSIYTADMSVKKMMLCKDDRHALGISSLGNNLIRVDLAGEKYVFDITGAKKLANTALQYIEQLYKKIAAKAVEYKNHSL